MAFLRWELSTLFTHRLPRNYASLGKAMGKSVFIPWIKLVYLNFTITQKFFTIKLCNTFCDAKRLLQTICRDLCSKPNYMPYLWYSLEHVTKRVSNCSKWVTPFNCTQNILCICNTLQHLSSTPSAPNIVTHFAIFFNCIFFTIKFDSLYKIFGFLPYIVAISVTNLQYF